MISYHIIQLTTSLRNTLNTERLLCINIVWQTCYWTRQLITLSISFYHHAVGMYTIQNACISQGNLHGNRACMQISPAYILYRTPLTATLTLKRNYSSKIYSISSTTKFLLTHWLVLALGIPSYYSIVHISPY